MPLSKTAQTFLVAAVCAALSTPALADQVMQVGISVSARSIDVDGNTVVLSGDVRIAATPDKNLVLKSEKRGLLVQFSSSQDRTVIVSPFDVRSETVSVTPDGMMLADSHGNTVTILTSGKLPDLPPTPAATVPAPAVSPPVASTLKPAPAPAQAPVTVTIIQTGPADDQRKEKNYDPVADRSAVLP